MVCTVNRAEKVKLRYATCGKYSPYKIQWRFTVHHTQSCKLKILEENEKGMEIKFVVTQQGRTGW
jgi:hypothetical protein